jgi:MFS family permease
MCVGQVGNLLPHVVVPAVMAQHLIPLWHLSGSEAGLMASSFAIGYMLAVPFLTTLTDRIDARVVLLIGSSLSAVATFAFGIFAHDLTTAIVIWGLAGIGFGGAYMPGLKALTDRLGPGDISRSVTLYTATFSFGVGLSFLISQVAADALGWRAAFYLTALGHLAMIATALAMASVKVTSPARYSMSSRSSATEWHLATCSGTVPTASSCMRCAPGSSPSGPMSRRTTPGRRYWSPSPSA